MVVREDPLLSAVYFSFNGTEPHAPTAPECYCHVMCGDERIRAAQPPCFSWRVVGLAEGADAYVSGRTVTVCAGDERTYPQMARARPAATASLS